MMLRLLPFLGPVVLPVALMLPIEPAMAHVGTGVDGGFEQVHPGILGVPTDPEIDRSPIWAMVYGRYLYLLGREMFWPDLDRKNRFKIAVVNWPDLAKDLGGRLEGRAIAGLPVDIVDLDTDALATEKGDFTMLFIGGSISEEGRKTIEGAISRWMRRDEKHALIVTDGGILSGHDVAFQRRKNGEGLSLCITLNPTSLSSKKMELPAHFLQRVCP